MTQSQAIHRIVGTLAAVVVMFGSVYSYVYPRTEGEKLEVNVKDLRKEHKEDMRDQKEDIKAIRKTVEEVRILLIRSARKQEK